MAIATTLSSDGSEDKGVYIIGEESTSLMDKYSYIMHGKIFKYEIKAGKA
jgi:hypothetical protein